MARDLLVRIRADATHLQSQLRTAQNSLTKFGKGVEDGSKKSSQFFKTWGPAIGLTVAAGAGAMVKAAADFDEAMSSVKATGADAAKNIDALRDSALRAGAATKFSATEAAFGVEALAKAGLSTADILNGGLDGALALSAAGNLDVAGSAEAAAAAMAQFSLAGEDVPHIADLLAAGAGKANGEVSDMAAALNQAGLVASGAGAKIEETTGTLAAFANAGLLGSDAGTSLKTMLQRLQNPLGQAKSEMKRLGISAYDANGNFIGLDKIAGQLRDSLGDMTQEQRSAALATIFGADAVRAANVLYKEGEGGIRKWTAEVDDAGFAADVAATKMDNLKGDLEKLKGSLDTLFIQGGSGSQGGLRTLVQELDILVNAVDDAGGAWDKFLKKVNLDGFGKTGGEAQGLFGALKEFMQAQRASDATGLDLETTIKFRTEGAPKAIAETARVATNARATPKQVRTALLLQGWSTKGIDAVIAAMAKIDHKEAVARIKLLNPNLTLAEIEEILAGLEDVDAKNPKPKTVKLTAEQANSAIAQVLAGVGDIESAKPTTTIEAVDNATSVIDSVVNALAGVKDKTVTVTTVYKTKGTPPGGFTGGRIGDLPRFAGGGKVPGSAPSDPFADNVLAMDERRRALMVRSGEWIINERASRVNDRWLQAINSGLDMNKVVPGFVAGRGIGSTGDGPPGELKISGRVTVNGLDGYIEGVAASVVSANNAHQRQAKARRKAS